MGAPHGSPVALHRHISIVKSDSSGAQRAPALRGDLHVLQVRRLRGEARLPRRAEAGAGGYDLYACGAQTGRLIGTGVALEIPPGWVGLVRDRSGMALSGRGYTVAGVIDSSYRGEIKIVFDREVKVTDGERVAQLVVVPHFGGAVEEVAALSATERGAAGFGSTGSHGVAAGGTHGGTHG
jgi:dUTP pyrophosphatase